MLSIFEMEVLKKKKKILSETFGARSASINWVSVHYNFTEFTHSVKRSGHSTKRTFHVPISQDALI